MTAPLFRLASITFDENEEVSAVTAVAAGPCLDFIHAEVPAAAMSDESPATVTLQVSEVLSLFRTVGELSGRDPRYPVAQPMWGSLSLVVYGIMEAE